MSREVIEMELVEYAAGDAFFEHERPTGSDISLVLPLDVWDKIGRSAKLRVSIEVAS